MGIGQWALGIGHRELVIRDDAAMRDKDAALNNEGKYARRWLPHAPCPMPHDGRCVTVGRAAQRTASPMPHAPCPITHYPIKIDFFSALEFQLRCAASTN
ncbi:MAG: hypothetical protein KME31_20975 [Tolypothrix carrinoi HA7290-LM1]|jgi:hypothetical protein|nr:hypothetical protein [Tolypothrix carrinoi HA7290-LM1]